MPLLSEFAAASCSSAFSLEQRAFVAEIVEAAASRLLHYTTAARPSDAPRCSSLRSAFSNVHFVHLSTRARIRSGSIA